MFLLRRESGRINGKVDGDDLLQQGRNGAKRVPQHRRQIVHMLALLRQLQQRLFSSVGAIYKSYPNLGNFFFKNKSYHDNSQIHWYTSFRLSWSLSAAAGLF